jgi:c-di-GMP-related signal transduction protein
MIDNRFFLGRQPIVGRGQELVAYELLFRSSASNAANILDDVTASAAVIQHVFSDLGVQQALGEHRGYINFSEELLLSDLIEVLPPDRVVLEILETVSLTPEVIARCSYLQQAGYRLALDDIITLSETQRAVLPYINVAKIDIHRLSHDQIAETVEKLRPYGVTLLAEKVETREEYKFCSGLGFDLFQGYFFAKPVILSGRSVQPSAKVLLKLFCLTSSDAELDELEDAVKQVPDLTLRLLRTVNAVAFGLSRKITSIRNAIFMLGRVQLNRLVQIMIFAQQSAAGETADPLLQTAAIRGRLMEGLATALGWEMLKDRAFIVGMLSLVDVLFQQPLVEIIQHLNLDHITQDALLERTGDLGTLLQLIQAIEQDDRDIILLLTEQLGLADNDQLNRLHVEALRWANSL